MVANGMGMTLLPEISIDVESAHGQVRLIRFEDPEPKRALGLAWRASSPRKDDFAALGKLIVEAIAKNRGCRDQRAEPPIPARRPRSKP